MRIRKLKPMVVNGVISLPLIIDLVRFQMGSHGEAWKIFTHMTWQERLILYRLGSRQPQGAVMLEIGSYLGASSCFLAAAALEIPRAKLHCVDTWENKGMSEGFKDTWDEFIFNTRRYRNVIVPHRGSSIDIAKSFGAKIDLLFIDGDHSYKGCYADVETWLPRLKAGGIILFHDIGWAEGVQRVVAKKIKPLVKKEVELPNLYWAWL